MTATILLKVTVIHTKSIASVRFVEAAAMAAVSFRADEEQNLSLTLRT